MTRLSRAVAGLVLAVVLASCAGAPAVAPAPPSAVRSSATVIEPPQGLAGDVVTAPRGTAILTLTGRIVAMNAGRSLRFDMPALDRLGVLKVGVYEPWVKQDLEFQGIWLADLLAAARLASDASSLHLTALDDYQIDLTTADVAAGGIFLATKRGDGSPIPVEEGGPTRIVFTGGVASGASPDRWIWSLTTIDVR